MSNSGKFLHITAGKPCGLPRWDKTGKVKQYCEAWSKKEGYPLHIIKGAAHFSNADNYDDVNKEISNFICG